MPDRVYITPRIERQLEQMAQQTNAPAVAAQRARQIIDSLIRGNTPILGSLEGSAMDGPDPVGAGLLRYRKDKRVKNSLKFDLGQGFRLLCIKERKKIYVMFLGDHDSSDAWLDHFAQKHPHRANISMRVYSVANDSTAPPRPAAPLENPSHDPLSREISQKMLRRIFSGLCAPG